MILSETTKVVLFTKSQALAILSLRAEKVAGAFYFSDGSGFILIRSDNSKHDQTNIRPEELIALGAVETTSPFPGLSKFHISWKELLEGSKSGLYCFCDFSVLRGDSPLDALKMALMYICNVEESKNKHLFNPSTVAGLGVARSINFETDEILARLRIAVALISPKVANLLGGARFEFETSSEVSREVFNLNLPSALIGRIAALTSLVLLKLVDHTASELGSAQTVLSTVLEEGVSDREAFDIYFEIAERIKQIS